MINAKRKDIDCGLGAAVVELWKWREVPMKAKKSYQLYRVLCDKDIYVCDLTSYKTGLYVSRYMSKMSSWVYKVMRVESECVAEYEGGKVVRKGQKRKEVRRDQ
jgi:hypothetical protein